MRGVQFILIFGLMTLATARVSVPTANPGVTSGEGRVEDILPLNTSFSVSETKGYQIITSIQTSWVEAMYLCKLRGMELATIRSKEDNDLFAAECNKAEFPAGGDPSNRVWIGGSVLETPPLGWSWATDAKPFIYTNWQPGEPNNQGGDERCVHFYGTYSTWNDLTCERNCFVGCEYFA